MLDRETIHHRTSSPAIHISPIEHGGGMLHTSMATATTTTADAQGGSTMLKITYEKPNRVAALQDETSRRSR